MNILIISQYFWPENFRINDLAQGLVERGHQVTVLTGIPNYPEGRYFSGYGVFRNTHQDYQGVKVIRVPLVPRGPGGRVRLILNYLSFALCSSLLAPFLCRESYDLIFVYEPSPITVGLPAIVLKHFKSIPIMFWVQDLWPESLTATGAVRSKYLLKMVERLVYFVYEESDVILVQSEAFFHPIQQMRFHKKKILYFPNSAEEIYQPLALESRAPERDQMPDGFRVMFAGNIGTAQDFPTILAAANILRHRPDIHWLILGDGRMRPWVEEKIHEMDLTGVVHLLGRHPVESMPRYFALAHALLATLKRDPIFSLTIPAKVQSYLACGIPVIAALDGEGARIISEAGAGIACPAESPEQLADAVLSLYRMPEEERRAMGRRGRQYFEKYFQRTVLLDQLDQWMKELQKEAKICAS